MKKFILEKNFSTGMTVHPLSSQVPPPTNSPLLQSSPSTTTTTPTSSSSSSLSPNIFTSQSTNGYNNNNSSNSSTTYNKSHRGVNSNQLIHPSAANPINSIGNHNDSGFQPYRGSLPANSSSSLEDGLLNSGQQQQQQQSSSGPSSANSGSSTTPSAAASSNIGNHILPYSERLRSAAVAAGYPYHPFIGSSHANPSAPMPQSSQSSHHNLSSHPLPPPPTQPYRIDDPLYLERYGLIRSSSNNLHQTSNVQPLSHSDLSPGHTSTNSNVPSYQMSSRYSELLATHQERVLNEETQRLLGHGSNSNHHHPHQHPPISSSGPTNYKMHSTNSEHGSRGRDYPNNGNTLPGMSTREMNTNSNSNKKHQPNGSITMGNPGPRPMNLTSNTTGVHQGHKKSTTSAILVDLKREHPSQLTCQQFGPSSSQTTITFTNSPVTTTSSSNVNNHLWRPQINERDDSRHHHVNSNAHNSRMFPDNVKRNVAFEVPIDFSSSKKQRFSDIPGDYSFKPSAAVEHQPETFIPSNHSSPFFINSSQDLQVHLLKSRPTPQSSSSSSQVSQQQQQQQQQQPSPPPLRQINFNNNNNTSPSKKLTNEVEPQCRQPLKLHQPPQPQLTQGHKDHSPQKNAENIEKVISKLDLMEMKLKVKRKERAERAASRGSVETSEDEDELIYSEEETSDEEENEMKKARYRCKYMITTGPPAKLDDRPEKVDFLNSLGLITLQRRNEILFEKYVSRRRFKSKSDTYPLVSMYKMPKAEFFDSENVFIQPTDILPNSLFKCEDKLEDKFNYMNLLGLKHELNADEIKKREQIWEGVLEERDRRRSINLSYGKITNNLTKEALDKWFQYLTSQPRVYNNYDRYNKNGYLNNYNTNLNSKTPTFTTGSSSFSSPPSHECNSVPLAVNNSWHNQRRTLNVTLDRKQSKQSKTNSKQGLLKSLDNKEILLNKSLKINNHEDKMKDDLLPPSSSRLNNKHKSTNLQITDQDRHESKYSEASYHNDTSSVGFKWPGIEAITTAYEKYALESQKERESLNGRIGQLKLTIREKTNAVDKLSKKIANLTKVQKEMDEESEQYERRISSIKTHLNEIVS